VAGPACAARGPDLPWFRDATADSGVDFEFVSIDFRGGPVAVVDTDGDGRLDVLAGSRAGGLAHFANRGGWSFAGDADEVGLALAAPVNFIAPGDLDNDGDTDLVVASDRILLYENLGDGRFAPAPGDLGDGSRTEHVLPVDLDGDGLLDLYVSNRDRHDRERSRNRLLRNRGRLVFEEVAGAAGADSAGMTWTASAIDIDGDGDLDLHVANDTLLADNGLPHQAVSDLPPDAFYRNELAETGELRFTDIAHALGLDGPRSSMGGLVADVDGDRRLDLYVTDFGRKKLFAGDGAGGFAERGEELGVDGTTRSDGLCASPERLASRDCLLLSWASQQADLDLDGNDDLVVVSGVSVIDGPPPPVLVLRGPPPYQPIDAGLGCFEGHALVAGDLDGDGDLDLVAGTHDGPLRLFQNQAVAGGRALRVALAGRRSNRDGRGAVVEVRTTSGRRVVRAVGAGGVAHSSPPPVAYIDLSGGGAETQEAAESIDVRWPSGVNQSLTAPALAGVGDNMVITEPEP